ncbi:NACHT domain-containing protein [Actinomadura scrupuli]|uniref:NACHT N-terminal Helical domain 1-containing protein n=1 Tax=Actinomadura scrupuli TaxID=559629 RepID=UPI003D97933E
MDPTAAAAARAVAQVACRLWLASRSDQATRDQPLIALIRTRFTDQLKAREVDLQFQTIALQVESRLEALRVAEFSGLSDSDRRAAIAEAGLTLQRADLTDRGLFDSDLDPVKLTRQVRALMPNLEKQFDRRLIPYYETVLAECCESLVHILINLPQFQARASVEILGRVSSLSMEIGAVLARLPRRTVTAPDGTDNDEDFTRRYLHVVSTELDTLELFGVRFERIDRPTTSLSVAYVSLTVTHSVRPRPEYGTSGMYSQSARVEAALAQSQRTLLRGEAGAGKSTILRWVAVTAARGKFSAEMRAMNGTVPFLIKLRSYTDGRFPAPEEFLDYVGRNLASLMPRGWAHRVLESGKAIVLVDGVDEVPESHRPAVRNWLSNLLRAFPNINVIVTSRPAAAEARWLNRENFSHGFIEPLSRADVRALIEHWHTAIRATDDLPCRPEQLPKLQANLLARLEAIPSLRALATNPLIAAVLCALNLDQETLPRDRMGVYQATLGMLVDTRDARRGISQLVGLSREQKIRLLQHLAWNLSVRDQIEMKRSVVENLVASRLAAMPQFEGRTEDVLDFLLQRSGVLREPVPGRIDFVHRSVQEYLAAQEAAELGDMQHLVSKAHLDQWRDTIVMTAGHANAPMRRELLAGMIRRVQRARNPATVNHLKLVVISCLETVPSIPDGLTEVINGYLDELVPPRNEVGAKSLASVGELVLRKLPASLKGLSESTALATIRTIWMINGSGALDLLSRYAVKTHQTHLGSFFIAWDYFDPFEYAQRVLDPLIERFPEQPILVKTPAQLDAVARVRQPARLRVDLESSPDVSALQKLDATVKELEVSAPSASFHARLLNGLVGLRHLTIRDSHVGQDLTAFASLKELKVLTLIDCGLHSLSGIEKLSNLRYLALLTIHKREILHLAASQSLRQLDIEYTSINTNLEEILQRYQYLEKLSLKRCRLLKADRADRADRSINENLRTLSLFHTDLSPAFASLALLRGLHSLDLSKTSVSELDPLAALTQLKHLDLTECPEVKSLTPLARLTQLRHLNLSGIPSSTDMLPLENLPSLEVALDKDQQLPNIDRVARVKRNRGR